MTKKLDAIVVPSGSGEQDVARLKAALSYGGPDQHYVFSGIGPDCNEVLFGGLPPALANFHERAWNFLMRSYSSKEIGRFGLDLHPGNSKGNLANCFPFGQEGTYGLVSEPWHLARFKLLEKKMKLRGKMSRDVSLEYIPTCSFWKQSVHDHAYGVAALVKALVFD